MEPHDVLVFLRAFGHDFVVAVRARLPRSPASCRSPGPAHRRRCRCGPAGRRPPAAPLQDPLFREMVGHIKETDLSVPELIDGYYYYSRTVKGRQYSILCRK